MSMQIPKWPYKLLKAIIKDEYLEEIEGDLSEIFEDDVDQHGLQGAKRRYAIAVARLFRLQLLKKIPQRHTGILFLTMRDFRLAYRALLKFKGHTAINLIGLSLGLAMGGFTLQYVLDELSFDNFHEKKDRIYKVVTATTDDQGMETNAWPVGYKLQTEYPEVEAVAYSTRATSTIQVERAGSYYEKDLFFASPSFLDIFTFDAVAGDAQEALTVPFSMVVTASIQDTYFKGEAIGRSIIIQDSIEYRIGAVVADPPANSHIQFDGFISFATYEKIRGFSYTEGWGNFNVRNYLLLKEGVDPENVKSKAADIYRDNVGDWMDKMGVDFSTALVPLQDVYLDSPYWNGMGPKGSRKTVMTLIIIAGFLMLLACINYINLSTARSLQRAKEVGIKKVNGSPRAALVSQFLLESFLLTIAAVVTAMVLVILFLPFFNALMGKQYVLLTFLNQPFLIGALVLIPAVTLLAGFYPAWILSGFQPLKALRGIETNARGLTLRRLLIAFQFFVSSGLVLATLLVIQQLSYMRTQDLGFDVDQVLVINATNAPGELSGDVVKAELQSILGVERVSFTNALPGKPGWQGQWAYPGQVTDEPVETEYMAIDESYLEVLGLNLLAGRNFDLSRPGELETGLIINETCVKEMGWSSPEEAIGQEIVSPSQSPAGTVVGVVEDYHGLGLKSEIWPKAMDFASHRYGRYYAVRFESQRTYELVEAVEEMWEDLYGNFPLQFSFLDQDFDRQYRAEVQLAQVLGVFAVIIIIVSGIGLLGLVSLMAVSKTKEIGIRKTLGATIGHIVLLLSKNFLLLVIIGNVLAVPFLWYFGNNWLDTFAYHVTLNPILFVYATLITAALAFGIVSFQVLKTARLNPADALRDE